MDSTNPGAPNHFCFLYKISRYKTLKLNNRGLQCQAADKNSPDVWGGLEASRSMGLSERERTYATYLVECNVVDSACMYITHHTDTPTSVDVKYVNCLV